MKLHLPIFILSSFLGTCVTQGLDMPDGYETVDLLTTDYLNIYASNSQTEECAFILWSDLYFSPTSNPHWSSLTSLVTGGNFMFTSQNGDTPINLYFADGESSVFKDAGILIFDTLSNLSFSNSQDSNGGGAIVLGASGQLYINNVSDGVETTECADVLFSGNEMSSSSYQYSRAIYSPESDSIIDISCNGDVLFSNNYAAAADISCGGAICFDGSLSIVNNGDVTFSGNCALSSSSRSYAYGGAIDSFGDLFISSNENVIFSDNYASASIYSMGGAIDSGGSLSITNNGDVTFSGNYVLSTAESSATWSYGGAIHSLGNLDINSNENVFFSDNYASSSFCSYGGAIYSDGFFNILNNGVITFSDNHVASSFSTISTSPSYGGAIYTIGSMSIANNKKVMFSGNYSFSSSSATYPYSYGGAIYSAGHLNIHNNVDVTFSENYATTTTTTYSYGGAIYSCEALCISDNGKVTFSSNYATTASSLSSSPYAYGGAISSTNSLSIINNGGVTFTDNSVSSFYTYGGAISATDNVSISNNGDIIFFENYASNSYYSYAKGGAIYSTGGLSINNNGNVSFLGNYASTINPGSYYSYSHGGAIYSTGSLILSNNKDVLFSRNYALAACASKSGAIYSTGSLCIEGNDSVIFEKNYEVQSGIYRLRSVYMNSSSGSDKLILSAKAGGHIAFYDSLYVSTGITVELNSEYIDKEGVIQKSKGDIIFTGITTETDIEAVKGSSGTEDELLASRTTEVYTMTNLYGGRLRVEDGAIYKGNGITAHANSDSTVLVKDAVLNHVGYELHFFEGTKLETLGESEIFGDVIVESTATVALSSLTRLEGSLTLASGLELSLGGVLTLDGALRLGMGLTLSGDVLEMVNQLQAGQSLTLMVGLDSLAVQTADLLRSDIYTDVLSGQCLQASNYFSNLEADSGLVLVYDGAVGSLSISNGNVIPEPATTTLSLLALSALVGCRRRKV